MGHRTEENTTQADRHIRYIVIDPTGVRYGYPSGPKGYDDATTHAWFGDRRTQLVDLENQTVSGHPVQAGEARFIRHLTDAEMLTFLPVQG